MTKREIKNLLNKGLSYIEIIELDRLSKEFINELKKNSLNHLHLIK